MSKTIYDEAIADAKMLRETAEQNAKNAIIEAVTPRIREFIEEQLIGEEKTSSDGDDDVFDSVISDSLLRSKNDRKSDDSVVLDETALEKLLEVFGSSKFSKNVRPVIREAMIDSLESLNESQKVDLAKVANKLKENVDLFGNSVINNDIDVKQENSEMSRNRDVLYEVDLDALSEMIKTENKEGISYSQNEMFEVDGDDDQESLKETLRSLGLLQEDVLEIDLGDTELPEDVVDALSRAAITVEREVEDEEEFDLDVDVEEEEGDVEVSAEEEVELPALDEVIEIDERVLKSELRRLRRQISEAKELAKLKGIKNDMAASWGGKGNSKAGVKGSYGGTGTGKSGVVGSYGGGKASGDPLKVTLNKLSEAVKNERRKNRSLSRKLSEYRSAVETLREQLTDLNLFNAKLLYVNKLMQNKGITAGQKRSIVESIDAAKSLREVKLLYKSLTQSASSGSGRLSESRTRRTLGSSSRTTGRSSSVSATAEVDRWAVLAGIKE
jgi:hypothetical protein